MKIFVTGGSGFVGKHVVSALQARGHVVAAPDHFKCDLLRAKELEIFIRGLAPDVIIHLAALVGGIGANMAAPADFWYTNLMMGLNILRVASETPSLKNLIIAGTTCSYPKIPPAIPFVEEHLFFGYPEETNAPYGIAKLALLEGARAYRRQEGLNYTYLVPTNLYGPGDNFLPVTSHVIPAMLLKMHQGKVLGDKSIRLWGDGTPTRDFLFVDDVAEAFAIAAEKPALNEAINLGSGEEVPMHHLSTLIRLTVGYEGEIEWDKTRPNGQPRRCLDSTKAKEHLKWFAKTRLSDGIAATYEWYLKEVTNG